MPQQHPTLGVWHLEYPCEPRCSVIHHSMMASVVSWAKENCLWQQVYGTSVKLGRFRQQVVPSGW